MGPGHGQSQEVWGVYYCYYYYYGTHLSIFKTYMEVVDLPEPRSGLIFSFSLYIISTSLLLSVLDLLGF